MGLFDKKYCDICGGKIGMLGNKKLDDGNMCKECASKLSPWFSERRHSTLAQIKEQLAYREANKAKVQQFVVTNDIATYNYHVFVDTHHGWFAVARKMDTETNPDIIEISQITSCIYETSERRSEEKYRDNEGNMRSYIPARYRYEYDYYIKISVRHDYFDEIRFKINSSSIEGERRGELMNYENIANQIVSFLSGNPGMNNGMNMGMGMNNGMNMGMGMNNGMNMGVGMNNGMSLGMGMNNGMNMGMNGVLQRQQMNQQMPNQQMNQQMPRTIQCDKCGWVAPDPNNIPKFCPMCGDPIDMADMH